jgi:hypothetical protein
MKIKRNILLAGLALMTAACSSGNDEPLSGTPLTLSATIQEPATRAGYTSFSSDDKIFVTIGDYQDVEFTTTDGTTFTPSKDVRITGASQEVKAYFNKYEVGCVGDTYGDEYSDVLYAEGTAYSSTGMCNLTFSHLMSCLSMSVTYGNGYSSLDASLLTMFKISGYVTIADFNPPNQFNLDENERDARSLTCQLGSQEFLVIPQTVDAFTVQLRYDGNLYTYTLEDVTWESGHKYSYQCKLSKEALVVTASDIEKWEDGNEPSSTQMEYVPQSY